MYKTKLGVPVGVVGAALYFMGLFGGFTPLILLAGYVLLFEENGWLKKTAVKAFALQVVISIAVLLVGLIPDVLGVVNNLLYIFEETFDYDMVNKITNFIISAIYVVESVLCLLLGIKAFSQGTIAIGFIDRFVNKYMDQ